MRRQLSKDISKLCKTRLSGLVAASTMFGFLAAGSPINPPALVAAVVGTGLCSASANCLNQWIERRLDHKMDRTKNRPLPTGRITPSQAIALAAATGTSGVFLLLEFTNPTTAAIGLANIALYAGVYTPLKQYTWMNTYVGAVVGALPPVMGWTAATNTLLAQEPLLLFTFQYLWQIPHFLALAFRYRKDYEKGGYQMLGVAPVDQNGDRCAKHSFIAALAMLPLPLYTCFSGMTSWMFLVDASAVNIWLAYNSWRFKEERTDDSAFRLFKVSLGSLALFLALFVFHKKQRGLDIENVHSIGSSLCPHEKLNEPDLCPLTVKGENTEIVSNTSGI